MDILQGRITIPLSANPTSLLALHERSLLLELSETMKNVAHDRDQINALILPRCQSLLEAIGHRSAFDAAVVNGVDHDIVELFVASIVALDPAWYTEVVGISREDQRAMLIKATQHVYPRLTELLDKLEVEPYIVAPIVSDEGWRTYVQSLNTHGNLQACTPHIEAGIESKIKVHL